MTLARQYNKLLKSRLLHYAAWSPVTDRLEVGDFGGFKRGVFQKLGNIAEFGVDPGGRSGGAATKFVFTSSGTNIVRISGGVEVDVFPDASVEAKLEINFSSENGLYIRTGNLSVTEMDSVDRVAQILRGKRDPSGRRWKTRWKVVRKVYTAMDPTILAASERDAGFTLSGKAEALKALEFGGAALDVSVSSTRQDALQIVGGTGPVAIDLFSVRILGGAGLEGLDTEPSEVGEDDQVVPELDTYWSDLPGDDLFE